MGVSLKNNEEKGSVSPEDDAIVQRILSGDVNAYELLLNRHKRTVAAIVKRHVPQGEIEEVAQKAFIRAYQSLRSYRLGTDFKKWISCIAVRSCHDYWRKAYRNREMPLSALTENHEAWLETVMTASAGEACRESAFGEEIRDLLEWALNQLSPQDRMVTELVYLEGMKGKEAAELLGWSVANVKVRAFRSRKKLRKLLESRKDVS